MDHSRTVQVSGRKLQAARFHCPGEDLAGKGYLLLSCIENQLARE